MTSEELESRLRESFLAPGEPGTSRDRLEQRLLETFDARSARPSRRPRAWRLGWAIALVSGGALALSAPSTLSVEVGKQIELRLTGEPPEGIGEAVSDLARESGASVLDIWVRLKRDARGSVVDLHIWGDRLPSDDALARALRAKWPMAEMTVTALEGHVPGTLGHRLLEQLLRKGASSAEREAARQALIGELLGDRNVRDAQVDVREVNGRTEVRVKVVRDGGGQ